MSNQAHQIYKTLFILDKPFYLPSIPECQVVAFKTPKEIESVPRHGFMSSKVQKLMVGRNFRAVPSECENKAGIVWRYWVPVPLALAHETHSQCPRHHYSLALFLSGSYFYFNIATVSPLTLHIINRVRKLIKLKNKSKSFRLGLYIQRQELWTLKFTQARWIHPDSNIEIFITFPLKVDVILLSYLIYGETKDLLLLKALFKNKQSG